MLFTCPNSYGTQEANSEASFGKQTGVPLYYRKYAFPPKPGKIIKTKSKIRSNPKDKFPFSLTTI